MAKGVSGPIEPLERRGESLVAEQAVALAAGGTGSAHLVEGTAGIGKTTVLDLFAQRGSAAGFTVLRAQAAPVEENEAWAGVRRLFDAAVLASERSGDEEILAGAAANARPALGLDPDGHGVVDPFTCVHGLYWLAANLCAERPLLLALDDIQWLDEPSARWLVHMASRAADLPILLVFTRRSGEQDGAAVLAELDAVPTLERLRPRALGKAASAALLRTMAGADMPDDAVEACHRVTGGNPFLLTELAASLRDEEASARSGDEIEAFGSESVGRSLRRRVDRLGPAASSVASLLAVLGEGTDLAEVSMILDIEPSELAIGVDALTAAGILSDEDGLRFTHPLLRSSLYESIEEGERSERHRAVAVALAAGGGSPSRVAAHLLRTAPKGDPWAVERLEEAAAEASRRGAAAVAVRYLERALAEPPDAERVPPLRWRRALLALGDGDTAARAELIAGVTVLPPPARAAAALESARALGLLTDHEGALAVCAATASEEPPAPALASRLADEMIVHMLPVGPSRWSGLDPEEIFGEAPQPPDPGAAALREVSRALVAVRKGQPMDVASLLAGMPHLLDEFPSLAFAACGLALVWSDELEAVRNLVGAALAQSRSVGSPAGAAQWSSIGALESVRSGRIAEGRAEAEASAEFNRDQAPATVAWPLTSLIDCLVLEGRIEDAEAAAAGLERPGDFLSTALLTESLGRLALAAGRTDEAVSLFTDTGRRFEAMGYAGPPITLWRSWLALALAENGSAESGAELAAEDLRRAEAAGSPRSAGFARLAVAACAAPAARIDSLDEAVAALRAAGTRVELARALLEIGTELRRRDKAHDARENLTEAMGIAAECGAAGLEERARTELVAAGGRPRRRALSGPESLTPSELRVARLVASGASNRDVAQSLFLSEKTVEGHLRSVFRKLSIGSRTEIAARLQSRRTQPADQEDVEVGAA